MFPVLFVEHRNLPVQLVFNVFKAFVGGGPELREGSRCILLCRNSLGSLKKLIGGGGVCVCKMKTVLKRKLPWQHAREEGKKRAN